MKVSDLLTELPMVVETDTSLDEARLTMEYCRIRHLPVVSGSRVVGVISDRDILMARPGGPGAARSDGAASGPAAVGRVGDVMTSPARFVGDETPLPEAIGIMIDHNISSLPIVDDCGLLGVITKSNLLRWYTAFCADHAADPAATARVADHMRREVVTVEPDDHARVIFERMRGINAHHLPVVRGNVLAGMVSDRDLRVWLGVTAHGDHACELSLLPEHECLTAADIMTPDPVTAAPQDGMAETAEVLLQHKFDALPVVRPDHTLAGIITVNDYVRLVRSLIAAAA